MKTILRQVLLPLLLLSMLASCKGPTELIEQGNYDRAVELTLKKLWGKKKKKEKYVRGLEEAFNRATQRDVAQISRLRNSGQPEHWEKIYTLFRQIERRQARVRPLLPLVDKDGYQANFSFVKTTDAVAEAKREMVAHFYDQARSYLAQAERGDKAAARSAHAQLAKIDRYYKVYKDKEALKRRAGAAGVSHVLVEIGNRSGVLLSERLESELLRFGVSDLDSRWQRYYLEQLPAGLAPDYRVEVEFTDIAVSPGEVRERIYTEEKEIDDGFDYVLDQNGNVLKDTSGNDVKVARTKLIRADVLENHQLKNAVLSGRLLFYDTRAGQLLHTQPLTAEAIFENYAATFNGDERALGSRSRRRIGNAPVPFPADEVLLLEAADKLKPAIRRAIRESQHIY